MESVTFSAHNASELARDVFISRISSVATLTCLVYDYLLTFDSERRLIWPSRLSIVKVAFLLNRYVPFIAAAGFVNVLLLGNSDNAVACKKLFTFFAGSTMLEYQIAEFILFMRAYAVWMEHKRLILTSLSVFYVIITGFALTFAGKFLRATTIDTHHIYPTGCVIIAPGHINKPPIILLMISETCALLLLVAKRGEWRSSALMHRLISDGIIYYVVAILASVANLVVLSTTSEALCNMILVAQAVLQSICCSRLLLGVRNVHCGLSHTASLFSSPEDVPDVRLYLYQMASAYRVSKSIKFASSSETASSPLAPLSPSSRAPSSSSPSSAAYPAFLSSPSSSHSPEISECRV